MEVVTKILIEHGMTGIFIIVLLFSMKIFFKQVLLFKKEYDNEIKGKENDNKLLSEEFRGYLMEMQKTHLEIIKENSEAYKGFSLQIKRANNINERLVKELERREYLHECRQKK